MAAAPDAALRRNLDLARAPKPLEHFLASRGIASCKGFADFAGSVHELPHSVASQIEPRLASMEPVRALWLLCRKFEDPDQARRDSEEAGQWKARLKDWRREDADRREERSRQKEREAKRKAEEDRVAQERAQREQAEREARERAEGEQRVRERCAKEQAKAPVTWTYIGMDTVVNNHDKVKPGMIYGIDFPWSAKKLVEFGPEWLTKAFHTAGTLPTDNKVTKIILEEKIKITAGNNAGKFLFEVRYEKKRADLHERLFAKIPFPLSGATYNDRLSSSVNKQTMDLYEINTYRFFEAGLPCKTPKYYFGDISNETTNYILINECLPFVDMGSEKKRQGLRPHELEGPYDKCKDLIQLKGNDREYYMRIFVTIGRIAGYHKARRLASDEFIIQNLGGPPAAIADPVGWRIDPNGNTGLEVGQLRGRLAAAIKFFSVTAKQIYPDYVGDAAVQDRFKKVLMTMNAYSSEVNYYKHYYYDLIALGHTNCNIDNAYFWRDDDGELDCGIFDWGGFGARCLPHSLWWCVNCADFDQLKANLEDYIDAFIDAYHEYGGPAVDNDTVRRMMLLTCFDNTQFMVAAVPNALKQCPAKEWATIKDRNDRRIADDVDGKSTLRTTLHVLNTGIRVIEELGGEEVMADFVQKVWVEQCQQTPKPDKLIFGE